MSLEECRVYNYKDLDPKPMVDTIPTIGSSAAEILSSFDQYGSLTEDQLSRQSAVKEAFRVCAKAVADNCPDGEDLCKALTVLREALDLSSKAIVSEPNAFFSNNLTLRGAFMKKNPYRWEEFMKNAGLKTPFQLHKVK